MNPQNKTKIISAFPCLGKTFFAANNKNIALDLESSDFSLIKLALRIILQNNLKV